MSNSIREVLEFVRENDVKFIRLAFCDILGVQKNISIMPGELPYAFEHGIAFNASLIDGFTDITKSDLLLVPDPGTVSILPWRPQEGRVIRFFCDIKNSDKTEYVCDTRSVLKKVFNRSEKIGYDLKIGTECQFYLFKTDENGEPTNITLDSGGYLDIWPIDKGENIRREICLSLEQMGIIPETSHHDLGPGQNVICIKSTDALLCADNILTFKSLAKAVAFKNGLYISFLPKPMKDKNGSALNVNISITQNGFNIFKNSIDEHSKAAESFIAGVLEKSLEMTLFLNPIENSYDRLGSFKAPKYVSWSHQNHSQLISIPLAFDDRVRMELRSPDMVVNPYLAFALIINAGLDGIENELLLPPPVNENLYTCDENIINSLKILPNNLMEAINQSKNSKFVKNTIGEEVLDKFVNYKIKEYNECLNFKNKNDFFNSTNSSLNIY